MNNLKRLIYIEDITYADNICNKLSSCSCDNWCIESNIDDFKKKLNTEDIDGAFIITENTNKYRNIIVSNNIIDIKNKNPESVIKEIKWIMKEKTTESKIFFTSDTHFSHRNIIRYCERPWNSGKDENGDVVITENNVEKMNNDLIDNWNSVVGVNDVVYHLGDFALGDRSKIPEIRSRLNGKINIVLGNHDWFHIKDKTKYNGIIDFFYKSGFEKVYDKPIIIDNFWILSHEPIMWVKNGSVWANLYGHVHNQEMYKNVTSNTYNCCVEVNDYKPVSFDEIKSKMENS